MAEIFAVAPGAIFWHQAKSLVAQRACLNPAWQRNETNIVLQTNPDRALNLLRKLARAKSALTWYLQVQFIRINLLQVRCVYKSKLVQFSNSAYVR